MIWFPSRNGFETPFSRPFILKGEDFGMSWRRDEPEPLSAEEAFGKLTIDYLRPLALLLTSDVPKRKPELVGLLVRFMTDPAEVRALYERLDPLAKKAVQEAAFDPKGLLQ